MQIPDYIIILGGLTLIIIVVVVVMFARKSRKVDLTTPDNPDEKPDWIVTTPPAETMAATKADGEGVTVFDYDEGEKVAAPFAEQIEDILLAHLKENPELASLNVDLGTGDAGDLEIWVDGTKYDQVADIPNPQLQSAIHQAIEKWNQHMDSQG